MRPCSPLAWTGLTLITTLLLPVATAAAPAPVGLHNLVRRAATLGSSRPGPTGVRLTPRVRPLPAYPPAPRRAGLQGRVKLLGTLASDGTIAHLRCLECNDDRTGFAAAALQAIANWSYEPVRAADGSPLALSILFDVEFRR